MQPRLAVCLVPAFALLASCWGDRARVLANMPSDSIPLTLGPDDIMIVNRDSTLELGLVGDQIVMRFGDRLRNQMQAALDTAKIDSAGGLSGMLGRAVRRTATSALSRRIEYPLADVEAVTLDGDRIEFHYRVRHTPTFESMKVDDRPALTTFRHDDAQRFVDRVRDRMATQPAN